MHQWITRMHVAASAARRKDARFLVIESDEPATELELSAIESRVNVLIPSSFRNSLLTFSRRIRFFWSLGDQHAPEELDCVQWGGCEWSLDSVAKWYDEVKWLQNNAFVGDESDYRIWQNKFPVQSIPNGDFIAINTTPGETEHVVYLSHELNGSHGFCLGSDFEDFMDRWTRLGCISDDIWPMFIRQREDLIQLDHPNAIRWLNWFGCIE